MDNLAHETRASITQWGIETFGKALSVETIFYRLQEELRELANVDPTDFGKLTDECADVVIMIHQLSYVVGFDLGLCVDHKMQINRGRKWNVNADGTGYHKPEEASCGSTQGKRCSVSLTRAEQAALWRGESFDEDLEIRRYAPRIFESSP